MTLGFIFIYLMGIGVCSNKLKQEGKIPTRILFSITLLVLVMGIEPTTSAMGNTLWIHQLCTTEADIEDKLDNLFERHMNHTHQHSTLLPIFLKSIDNVKN